MNQEITKCPKCGTENLSTFTTCTNCGEALKEEKVEVNAGTTKTAEATDKKAIFKLILGIVTIIGAVIGIINTVNIFRGLSVFSGTSSKITIFGIIEALAPLAVAAAGLFTILKRKSTDVKDNLLTVLVYVVALALVLLPLILIPDPLYLMLGIKKLSPITLEGIIVTLSLIFYIYYVLFTSESMQKKALKVLLTILTIIIAVVIVIVFIKVFAPSDLLYSD